MRLSSKITSITNLATTIVLNAKINDFKSKLPNIINLATTTALTAVENKILNVSNLVKKGDYNTKINETEKKIVDHDHDRYITPEEFNKLTAQNYAATLVHSHKK